MDDELVDFVRGRYQHLLRRAYLLTGSHSAAEDLVQEALARCFVAWRRGTVSQPEAYVVRTMVNLLTSHARRRLSRERLIRADLTVSIGDGAIERAERDALWRALQQTPPRQRAVLVLRFYEDMDEKAIAAALNIAIGTVRSQTAKGLQRLRHIHAQSQGMEVRGDR